MRIAGIAMMVVAMSVLTMPVHADDKVEDKACTQIGCTDGLHLSVDPSFGWIGGIYDISVQTERGDYHCQGTLPLKPCGNTPTFGCNSRNITIGESGCALPAAAHAISGIHINGRPSRVQVTITRNGNPYISRMLSPDYERVRPNGPGCGPVCRNATYDLLTAQ